MGIILLTIIICVILAHLTRNDKDANGAVGFIFIGTLAIEIFVLLVNITVNVGNKELIIEFTKQINEVKTLPYISPEMYMEYSKTITQTNKDILYAKKFGNFFTSGYVNTSLKKLNTIDYKLPEVKYGVNNTIDVKK